MRSVCGQRIPRKGVKLSGAPGMWIYLAVRLEPTVKSVVLNPLRGLYIEILP